MAAPMAAPSSAPRPARPRLALTRRVVEGAPPDPAPSRLAYRLRRAWLRPWVRRTALRGAPALVLVAALAAILADGEEIAALGARWASLRAGVEARPEFAVVEARIEGAGPDLEPALRAALPPLPSSSLRLDLEALREALAALPPVARAEVRVAPGGVLSVRVEERAPAVAWRGPSGLHALDAEGRVLRALPSRAAAGALPLVAGEGADRAVAEALALHAVAGPLAPKLQGFVRVGERRWDAVLREGPRVMLPETGAVAALERAAAWEAAEDLSGRDVTHLDLRDPARPALRLRPAARAEMARLLAEARAGRPQPQAPTETPADAETDADPETETAEESESR